MNLDFINQLLEAADLIMAGVCLWQGMILLQRKVDGVDKAEMREIAEQVAEVAKKDAAESLKTKHLYDQLSGAQVERERQMRQWSPTPEEIARQREEMRPYKHVSPESEEEPGSTEGVDPAVLEKWRKIIKKKMAPHPNPFKQPAKKKKRKD